MTPGIASASTAYNNIRELAPINRDNASNFRLYLSGVAQPDAGYEDYFTLSIPSINPIRRADLLAVNVEPPTNSEYVQLRFKSDSDPRVYTWSTASASDPGILTIYIPIPSDALSFQVRGAYSSESATNTTLTTDGIDYVAPPYRWAYTPWTGERALPQVSSSAGALPSARSDDRVVGAIEEMVGIIVGGDSERASPFTPVVWALFAAGAGVLAGGAAFAKGDALGPQRGMVGLALFTWVAVAVWCIGGPTLAGIPYWAAFLPGVGLLLLTLIVARTRFS